MKGFLVLLMLIAGPAFAAPTFDVTPCECALQGIEFTGANWRVEALSNGLDDYMVDLNADGLADIEFLVPQGDSNRVPLFYWMNSEKGEPLYTLEDSLRDGTCHKMKVVWDKYKPKKPDWKGGA